MTEEAAVRIRRLEDRPGLLRRRPQYEIEERREGVAQRRIVTPTPGSDLSPLLGPSHPADVSAYTDAADLAWDGGVGQWRTGPAFAAEEPAQTDAQVGQLDPPAIRSRARRFVHDRAGDSPGAALAFLAAVLDRVGHGEVATVLGALSGEWMTTHDPESRALVADRVASVWADHGVPQLRPVLGSATEWAVCEELVARVPRLLESAVGGAYLD